MHELAVTQNVLDIVLRNAAQAEAQRVTDVHLVVGQLSSIVDDSVSFYWDLVAKGTAAEGARLHFRRIPARLRCQMCEREYGLDGSALACPDCGASRVQVLAGDEFSLEAIEVESAERASSPRLGD